LDRVYVRYFSPGGEKGRSLQPPTVLAFCLLHHLAALTLAIPMNIYFSDSYDYAVLIFLLQFAAGVALLISQYVVTLDVKIGWELLQMRVLCTAGFCIILPTRGPLFVIFSYRLLRTFYQQQAWFFFATAMLAAACMMILNTLFIIDASKRMMKFYRFDPRTLNVSADVSAENEPDRMSSISTQSGAAMGEEEGAEESSDFGEEHDETDSPSDQHPKIMPADMPAGYSRTRRMSAASALVAEVTGSVQSLRGY